MKTWTQQIDFNNPEISNKIIEHIVNENGVEIKTKVVHTSYNIETSNIKYFKLLETRNHYLNNGLKVAL